MTKPTATTPQDNTEARLPRPPGVVQFWFAEHPRVVDIAIVACYVFGAVMLSLLDWKNGEGATPATMKTQASRYLVGPVSALAVLRLVAVGAALFFRRRFPFAGLVVTSLALLGDHGSQLVATTIAQVFLLFAVPAFRSVAAGWVAYAIALVANIGRLFSPLLQLLWTGNMEGSGSEDAVGLAWVAGFSAAGLLAALMLGINLGERQRYLNAVIDRVHQLARERDQLAQLAVAEERSRIAREMHDIVAHSVSVMIALSEGASRTIKAAPEAAAEAMQRSAETGRNALAEMRRLLGALQEPGSVRADLAPQPGSAQIPELVQGFRDAGLSVGLEIDGLPESDQGKGLALYRVIQEALTNVLRYAGIGTMVTVSVRSDLDGTIVEVTDSGPAPGASVPITGIGSGRGLAGLAERVRVFGGDFDTGPRQSGSGWYVRATLPTQSDSRGER